MGGCCGKICGMCDGVGCCHGRRARRALLVCDLLLMLVALLASVGGALGLTNYELIMEYLPWATSEGVHVDTYLNLYGLMVDVKGGANCTGNVCIDGAALDGDSGDILESSSGVPTTACVAYDFCTTYSWEELDEPDEAFAEAFANFSGSSDYVQECNDASFSAMPGALMGCISSLLCVIVRICRGRWDRERDVGRKCSALLQTLLPVLSSADALYFYGLKCISKVNDVAPDGVSIMPGNGLYAQGGSLVLSLLGFVIHLLLPGRQGSGCCRGSAAPARVAPDASKRDASPGKAGGIVRGESVTAWPEPEGGVAWPEPEGGVAVGTPMDGGGE